MPATVTLTTTTLTKTLDPGDTEVSLASVSGINPSYRLWIDKESMRVISVNPDMLKCKVVRGEDGSGAARHVSSATVTIAQGHQLYMNDPVGAPDVIVAVSPYINTVNGKIWYAQGDAAPDQSRWWQEVTNTYGNTSLGIRTFDSSPSSST